MKKGNTKLLAVLVVLIVLASVYLLFGGLDQLGMIDSSDLDDNAEDSSPLSITYKNCYERENGEAVVRDLAAGSEKRVAIEALEKALEY